MSRWKFKTSPVTDGDGNTQNVRGLTAGERAKFASTSEDVKAGTIDANDLPFMVASWGCVDPACTAEEVREMPPALLDLCVLEILKLSGMKDADTEKKEPTTDSQTS